MSDPCQPQPRKWWVATATYVAECQSPKIGDPVKITRQGRSCVSMEDATRKAMHLAKCEALAELRCQWIAVQCWQPMCGTPLHSPICATALSDISQADANDKAILAAKSAADAYCLSLMGFVDSDTGGYFIDSETGERILDSEL